MRLTKSLLCGIAALLLAAGTAFAGQESTVQSSAESSQPELLGGPEMMASESAMAGSELMAAEEEVIYLVPLEVTEYYLIIPQSPELG
jgi:hypothetical protein